LSLALAVGSRFLIVVLPIALAFTLYVAPTRRIAALAIWAVACGIGALLLYASSFFTQAILAELRHASFFPVSWRAFSMAGAYHQVLAQLGQSSPALVLALPVALITYFFWPRRVISATRRRCWSRLYFILGVGTPHFPDSVFSSWRFHSCSSGRIAADLPEARFRQLAQAAVWGLLVANAAWHLWELARAGRG
jgi:hypothetical protein